MGTIGEIKVKVTLVKNLHSVVESLLLVLARRRRTIENYSVAKERRKKVKKEKRKKIKVKVNIVKQVRTIENDSVAKERRKDEGK